MRQASYSRSSDGQKDGYACANPVKEAETLERRRMSDPPKSHPPDNRQANGEASQEREG